MKLKTVLALILLAFMAVASVVAQVPNPEDFDEIVSKLTEPQKEIFQKLAEKGDSKAQVIVGMMLLKKAKSHFHEKNRIVNEKVDKTFVEIRLTGFDWLRKASDGNYAPAHYILALASKEIFGCEDYVKELEKAVAANYPSALLKKAYEFLDPSCHIKHDNQKALELFKRCYELGILESAFSIGEVLSRYIGGAENQIEANVWFLKAAEAGDSDAQDSLGVRISEGIGTESNNTEAVKWFMKSAEQGHVYGSCNLALHYARGWGVAKNSLLALKWSIISNSLDSLNCNPDDFVKLLKPRKTIIKNASKLAIAWLRAHPNLTNNFDQRPWLGEGDYPQTLRQR
jgi:TPR repeat protein